MIQTRTDELSTSFLRRALQCVILQSHRQRWAGLLADALPTPCFLTGKNVLITGASKGVGEQAAAIVAEQAQCKRLVIASRTRPSNNARLAAKATFIPLDLDSKASIRAFVDALAAPPLDVLILNAAVVGLNAYQTNVLGNAALVQALIDAGKLSSTARIVCVTGDIYITEKNCTPDFTGNVARCYARSKLGLNWYAMALQEKYPALEVCLVHPGVIYTDLVPTSSVVVKYARQAVEVDARTGAWSVVIVASVPSSEFKKGGYAHNVMGWCTFAKDDPVNFAERRRVFCEDLAMRAKL